MWPGLEPVWVAFWVLSSARGMSVGLGGAIEQPIAYGEIARYAADHGLQAPDLWGVFLPVIQAMDREYRSIQAQKRAAENPPTGKGGQR